MLSLARISSSSSTCTVPYAVLAFRSTLLARFNGSVIQEDEDANGRFYGRPMSNRDLIDQVPRPVGTAGSEATGAVNVWHRALAKHAK